MPETGGQVVYTLTVTNDSFVSGDPVTITELSDSVFGSFFPQNTVKGVIDTDCFDLENVRARRCLVIRQLHDHGVRVGSGRRRARRQRDGCRHRRGGLARHGRRRRSTCCSPT